MDRIQTTRQKEKRQNDEELNDIATQYHEDLFAYGIGHDTCRDLC